MKIKLLFITLAAFLIVNKTASHLPKQASEKNGFNSTHNSNLKWPSANKKW